MKWLFVVMVLVSCEESTVDERSESEASEETVVGAQQVETKPHYRSGNQGNGENFELTQLTGRWQFIADSDQISFAEDLLLNPLVQKFKSKIEVFVFTGEPSLCSNGGLDEPVTKTTLVGIDQILFSPNQRYHISVCFEGDEIFSQSLVTKAQSPRIEWVERIGENLQISIDRENNPEGTEYELKSNTLTNEPRYYSLDRKLWSRDHDWFNILKPGFVLTVQQPDSPNLWIRARNFRGETTPWQPYLVSNLSLDFEEGTYSSTVVEGDFHAIEESVEVEAPDIDERNQSEPDIFLSPVDDIPDEIILDDNAEPEITEASVFEERLILLVERRGECILDESFGIEGRFLWTNGCRGIFLDRDASSDSVFVCGRAKQLTKCLLPSQAGSWPEIVRVNIGGNSEECSEEETFGVRDNSVWVDHGCRAKFIVRKEDKLGQVACRSEKSKYRKCEIKWKQKKRRQIRFQVSSRQSCSNAQLSCHLDLPLAELDKFQCRLKPKKSKLVCKHDALYR